MKKISFLILIIVWSCSPKMKNDFDEIIHYTIEDSVAKKLKNDQRFSQIYSDVNAHKINYEVFENELIMYGYKGKTITKANKNQVDDIITNTLYYGGHLVACEPIYRDILILKKNQKNQAVVKLCFECGMTDAYGKIKSNVELDDVEDYDLYQKNFRKLYTILHGKEYREK